jgi:O-antigen/teichoic acid export membrane protein
MIEQSTTAKVIRGIFSITISSMVRTLVGFLAIAIAVRVISENDMGVAFLLLALVSLLETIANVGLRMSSAKFIASAQTREEQADIVNNIVSLRIITIVAVVILSWLGKPVLLMLFPSEQLSGLYYFVPLVFSFQLSDSTLSYIMQGYQLYRKMAIVDALSGFINCILIIIALVVFKLGMEGYILAYLFSLVFGVCARLFLIPTRIKLSFDRQLIKKIFNFGLPLQINDIFTYIIEQIDTLMVASMLNPTNIAYIGVARKIPQNLNKIVNSNNSVYFPHLNQLISQGKKEETERFLNNFIRLTAGLTLLVTFEVFIFQNDIIRLVFSEKYIPSGPGMSIHMMVLSIVTVSQILDAGYVAGGYPAYVLIVNLVVASLVIACNWTLIPQWGFMGAIVARLIAEVVGNGVSFWAIRKAKIKVKLNPYLFPTFLMIVCLAVFYIVNIQALLFKCLMALTFPILLFCFSIITINDIKKVLNSLPFFSKRFNR